MADTIQAMIVPHTHWDREWYQTFQQFRMRLVHAVDSVLQTLETDPNFSYFMLDGQTIVLEDYLEVRPENADRLRRLAREGRILIGPWYLQPDEFLVGGESLIRNLQIGRRMAEEYGGAMPIGYVPDTFGHIAQLPQILRGFGLDNAIFWRGVPPEVEQGAFRWDAPDGSDVLVLWLYDELGYSNAAALPLELHALAARITQLVDRMRPRAVTSTFLLMNGSDHLPPQPGLPAALAEAAPLLAERGISIRIGSLPQYVEQTRAVADDLPLYHGEMTSSHSAHLLPGVFSTRMWLKQRNAACEALLTRWAEPAATWAASQGAAYPTTFLQRAWRFLLHNHPHDSICGCGIDQTHAEMLPRFDQSEQIAELLTREALTYLADRADTHGQPHHMPLVVFNPSGSARSDSVYATAQTPFSQFEIVDTNGETLPYQALSSNGAQILDQVVPKELALAGLGIAGDGRAFGYIFLDGWISLPDADGQVTLTVTVATQGEPNTARLQAMMSQIMELGMRDDITSFRAIVREAPHTEMLIAARDIPAHGGRVFFLRAREHGSGERHNAPGTELQVSVDSLENAHLRVEVSAHDGALTLHDKHTCVRFTGLNALADSGDVGDLYTYCPPAHDTIVDTLAQPPRIEVAESGPARATVRITRTYQMPISCALNRSARSDTSVPYEVVSEVSLVPGGRRVEIRTTVENTARDHRLRMLFPVPFVADYGDAEGSFVVTRRPARQPEPTGGIKPWQEWYEVPVNTHPQKRFVDVSNGEYGLAVLNRGLPEYEVAPDPQAGTSAVALTLLRCVEWLSRDDLTTRRGHAGPALFTPAAQGIGKHTFEYALVPHAGDWRADDALVLREADAYEAPLRAVVTEQHEGALGASWSFAQVAPASVALSAVKRAEDSNRVIVRLYNPLPEAITAEVTLDQPFADVALVTLNEDPLPENDEHELARFLSTGVRVHLRGCEIVTLAFTMGDQ